jgi:hypothetical protein
METKYAIEVRSEGLSGWVWEPVSFVTGSNTFDSRLEAENAARNIFRGPTDDRWRTVEIAPPHGLAL